MTESPQALPAVTRALGVAAFVRQPDGGFAPLAPAPDWFVRVTSDDTFPFLGHILEEATTFWHRSRNGRADWGPVADVDESGREFHYVVTALAVDGAQYLVFQTDPGTERMREILQKVRVEALSAEQDHASHRSAAVDLHRMHDEVNGLLAQLTQAASTPLQIELVRSLTEKSLALEAGIGRLIRSTTVKRA